MTRQEKIDIIKQHIFNVIAKEQPKYKTIPNCFIFDRKEFFEDTKLARLNKKYNLIRNNSILAQALGQLGYFDLSKYYTYSRTGGFTNGKEITILLNDATFNRDFNEQLYFKILSTFHEFKHVGQKEKFDINNYKKPIISFEHFRYLLEKNCHRYMPLSYALSHDDFYFEIDANIYGIEQANEYCSKNNISAPDFQRQYAQRQYSKMLTYDFDNFIELNRLLSMNPMLSNSFFKNPTYDLFFNKNGGFKKLSDITKNPVFYSLEDKLKIEMLTSRSFLSSINYNLNNVEINFLLENIDHKINDLIINYNKNKEFYEKGIFDQTTFIKNSSVLLSRLEFLLNFKLKYSKTKATMDVSFVKFQEQIKSIRSACELNHNNNLTYETLSQMDNKLNTIITALNTFFDDSNNLNNHQQLLTTIKMLQEAILAKIDINSVPLSTEYVPIIDEDNKNKGR